MNLIVVDTREKGHKKILEYFNEVGQNYIISKLDFGDYMIYKQPRVVIDKKDGLMELAHNLCNTNEHERVKKEIQRAFDGGCEEFYFLIQSDTIKSMADIKAWTSPRTKVKGSTLFKIMVTMSERYGIKFRIVPKKKMGEEIIKLLTKHN